MEYLKNIIKGVIIGISMMVPGVSGGTMAIVLGIYDRLVHSVATIFKDFKNNLLFLVQVGTGGAAGVLDIQPPDGRSDDRISAYHAVPDNGHHHRRPPSSKRRRRAGRDCACGRNGCGWDKICRAFGRKRCKMRRTTAPAGKAGAERMCCQAGKTWFRKDQGRYARR